MDLAAVRVAYRRYARFYDLIFTRVFAAGRRHTLNRVNRRGGLRILEVGIGTGLSLPFHRHDNHIVGIDASQEMLAIARQRVERENLQHVEALLEIDATHMPFETGQFDVVVAMYVMSVVPEPAKVLREMRRVCKAGGEIYMVNHFAAAPRSLGYFVEKCLRPFEKFLGWHTNCSLHTMLAESNLRVLAIKRVGVLRLFSLIECRNEDASTPPPPEVALSALTLPA
jgi:phosphatidylethanolamine/phosphatidyl-N-methylethanolamine N-methyltransferase